MAPCTVIWFTNSNTRQDTFTFILPPLKPRVVTHGPSVSKKPGPLSSLGLLSSLGEFRIFPRPIEFSKYHTSFLPPPWPPRLPLKSTQEAVPFGVALARLASVFWRIWKRFLRICAGLSTLPKLPFRRSSAGQGEMPSWGSLFSDLHSNGDGVALPLCAGASGCA